MIKRIPFQRGDVVYFRPKSQRQFPRKKIGERGFVSLVGFENGIWYVKVEGHGDSWWHASFWTKHPPKTYRDE